MGISKNGVAERIAACQLPDTVSAHALATEALDNLSVALATLQHFKVAGWVQLDIWQEQSFLVAEQGLKRAHLAFSQLHADLPT